MGCRDRFSPLEDPRRGPLDLENFGNSYPCLLDILTLEEFSDQSILVLSVYIHGLVIDHAVFAHAPHQTAIHTLHSNQSIRETVLILWQVHEDYVNVTKWITAKKQA